MLTLEPRVSRLVLIDSGQLLLSDMNLDRPVHLKGDNNVGKTTILSALQFLFVGSERRRHFKSDTASTLRHYFPRPSSLILFECITSSGYQVVILKGDGPAKNHSYTVYKYLSKLNLDDFLTRTDSTLSREDLRSWEEIQARLIGEKLIKLTKVNLSKSLAGIKTTQDESPLGLLRFRDQVHGMELFEQLFSNLIRCSKLSQAQLMKLFISSLAGQVTTQISPPQDVREQYFKLKEDQQGVENLKRVESDIGELSEEHEKHLLSTKEEESLSAQFAAALSSVEESLTHTRRDLDNKAATLTESLDAIKSEIAQMHEDKENHSRRQTRLEFTIQDLEKLRDKASEYVELYDTKLIALQGQQDELTQRIMNADDYSLEELETRRRHLEVSIGRRASAIDNYTDNFLTYLRDKQSVAPEQIASLSRLLRFDLFQLEVGTESLEVTGAQQLTESLSRLQSMFVDDYFEGLGLRINLRQLEEASHTSASLSLEELKRELTELQADLLKTKGLETDARDTAKLKEERQKLSLEYSRIKSVVDARAKWLASQDDYEANKREHRELSQTITELSHQLSHKSQEQEPLQTNLREVSRSIGQSDLERQSLLELQAEFQRGDYLMSDAASASRKQSTVKDLSGLKRLKEELTNVRSTRISSGKETKTLLTRILDTTKLEQAGRTTEEMVGVLLEEISALPRKEQRVHDLMRQLCLNVSAQFKELRRSFDDLGTQVDKFSRRFKRRKISDLDLVEIKLRPHEELISKLDELVESSPLFGHLNDQLDTRYIERWLEHPETLRLEHLGHVEILVTSKGRKLKPIRDLDSVESEGTSFTLKLFIQIEFLNMLTKENSCILPVQIDESGRLDPQNLSTLLRDSVGLGFTPIFASPYHHDLDVRQYIIASGQNVIGLPDSFTDLKYVDASN